MQRNSSSSSSNGTRSGRSSSGASSAIVHETAILANILGEPSKFSTQANSSTNIQLPLNYQRTDRALPRSTGSKRGLQRQQSQPQLPPRASSAEWNHETTDTNISWRSAAPTFNSTLNRSMVIREASLQTRPPSETEKSQSRTHTPQQQPSAPVNASVDNLVNTSTAFMTEIDVADQGSTAASSLLEQSSTQPLDYTSIRHTLLFDPHQTQLNSHYIRHPQLSLTS